MGILATQGRLRIHRPSFPRPSDMAEASPIGLASAMSGRLDSNQRPLRPERSTLANLSYAPLVPILAGLSPQTKLFPPIQAPEIKLDLPRPTR